MTNAWRRIGLYACAATLFLCFACMPASAQTLTTAAIHGTVVDNSGQPLAEALVTLAAAADGFTYNATTDRLGTYRFNLIAPGQYQLSVERIGFTPVLVRSVAIRAGAALPLVTVLHLSEGVATAVDTLASAAAAAPRFGGVEPLAVGTPSSQVALRHAVGDLTRSSARMSADGSAEGLPGMLGGMILDGALFRPVRHPLLPGGLEASPLPLAGLASGEVVTNGVDVEWGRAAGGVLMAASRMGAARPTLTGRALVGASAVSPASAEVAGSESATSLLGEVAYSGPLMSDSARLTIGASLRRLQTPMAAAWPQSDPAAALLNQFGGEHALQRYARAEPATENGVGAFGSLAWLLTGRHRLSATAHFGHASAVPMAAGSPFAAASATDALGMASLYSTLSDRFDNDLRVSVTRSERDADVAFTTPFTYLAGDAIALGGSSRMSRASETVVTVADALHFGLGPVTAKVGVELSRSAHSYTHRAGAGGSYWFGDIEQLLAGQGVFARTEGPAGLASWGTPRPAGFAQVNVPFGAGLHMLLGGRAERETFPGDRVRQDTAWLRLTGISNTEAPDAAWRFSPRAGVTWDVGSNGRWVVSAGAGMYYDRVDPLLLAEWQIDDGTASVRRVVGNVAWPDLSTGGGMVAPRLTVLAPNFAPPRTGRASGGINHAVAAGTTLSLSGTVRRTENLPRRTDLNLSPQPAWRDQHGRGVYGTLVQQGGLVTAQPGTGRRFPTWDEVAGITADGWSDHWGIDVAVDHDAGRGVGVLGRYSYGQTRDNWVGAAAGGWAASRPTGFDGDASWADATSDFDVPHRLVAGVSTSTSFGLRLSGLYRLESGRPFTPGFRTGVDIDASGFAGSGPAFVDIVVAGMDEIVAAWPCLQSSAGRFAARNSCRTDALHGLDVGISMELLRGSARSATVLLELFDLLESRYRAPDAALYLVDPTGTLTTDAAARTVNVPLVANPDFGEPLPQRYSGRMLRLGIALNW
jgi:hypothetical protein